MLDLCLFDLINGNKDMAMDARVREACDTEPNIRRMCDTLHVAQNRGDSNRAKVAKKRIACTLQLTGDVQFAQWPEKSKKKVGT